MIKKLAIELLRRGVVRAVAAYIAIVWLLAQGVVDIFPALGLPAWAVRGFLVVCACATPLVAIIAWKYDLTRKGFLPSTREPLFGRGHAIFTGSEPTRRSGTDVNTSRAPLSVHWTGANGEPHEKEFVAEFTIGRDFDADVRIEDGRVSRRHVSVYPQGAEWYVKDLSSLNGSYADGLKFDVRKIEGELSVSLDRLGPVVRLFVRAPDTTLLSASTPGESLS